MKGSVALLLSLAACAALPPSLRAQEAPPPAAEALRPHVRARVSAADPLLDFATRPVAGGRLDAESGVRRAAYRLTASAAPAQAPASTEAAVRAYLEAARGAFGWRGLGEDLAVDRVVETPRSRHVTLRQTLAGVPVYNRRVQVNLDAAGRPTMVVSGYAPHLRDASGFSPVPTRSAAAARRAATDLVEGAATAAEPELVAWPAAEPRLAWRVVVWPASAAAEFEVLLDAHTGEPLQIIQTSTHGGGAKRTGIAEGSGPAPARPLEARAAAQAVVDGEGCAFLPDPVSMAGVSYGPPYDDADDADVPEINAQRVRVPLRDITLGTDGRYRLDGPFVRIDGSVHVRDYVPPEPTAPDGFCFSRADDGFEAVMAYYHIDESQRHVQALALGRGVQDAPIRVNPQGSTADNSQFFPGSNTIYFGTGAIDDAEDAAVIWHEYAHALLEASATGLTSSTPGLELHEGWADYWAASYVRGLVEEGRLPAETDWRQLFAWDGNAGAWCGRRLEHPGHWPDAADVDAYPPPAGCGAGWGDYYTPGMLWATTLMELWDALGRTTTDRLNLLSHAYLDRSSNLQDAAEALIQADLDHYGGAHASFLIETLAARGFVEPSAYGPVLQHEPLAATEQLGGTRTVAVEAAGVGAAVQAVTLVYRLGGGAEQRVPLARTGGAWGGALPLPEAAGTVAYALEAEDAEGRTSRLPAAPGEMFTFAAGPDTAPPLIQHAPPDAVALVAWPLDVVATVTDELGVDSVWVTYALEDAAGAVTAEGAFRLSPAAEGAAVYRGTFPAPLSAVSIGGRLRYRIRAVDRARAVNAAAAPADAEAYEVSILSAGLLQSYAFEGGTERLQATGAWARGTPGYGMRVAHGGRGVWATNLDGAYPAEPEQATLELPALDLSRVPDARLVFWHWHDFEHDGRAGAAPNAFLYDGGNVKASTDGGRTWQVLGVEGGYTGRIVATNGNPLGGEPAFGGYSYGWQRAVVPLPQAPDVRLRFDAGTDEGNTAVAVGFAGWMIDDVLITTDVPPDAAAPAVADAPPALQVLEAMQPPPPLFVRALDDLGVARVEALMDITRAGTRVRDTLRLAMTTTDLHRFRGQIALDIPLGVGDAIEYRLRVTDVGGRVVLYPAAAAEPLRIKARLVERVDLLAAARGSGGWQARGSIWRLDGANVDVAGGSPPALVLASADVPTNAPEATLILTHEHALSRSLTAAIEASTDGARTWAPVQTLTLAGTTGGPAEVRLGLDAFGGEHVQLRVRTPDAAEALGAGTFWEIHSARLLQSTPERAFEVPRELALHPAFPNPFRSTATFGYTLPEEVPVRLEAYDLLGRRVAVFVDGMQPAGSYTLTFDGTGLSSGVYLLRLQAGGATRVQQVVLAR